MRTTTAFGGTLALLLGSAGPVGAGSATDTPTEPPGGGADDTTGTPWMLPPFRVESTPLRDALGPLPLAATHLGADAIRRRPGENLGTLLRPVVGVRVSSHGSADVASGVSIRGSTTDQVLVLVDGRRWQTAQGGGADLSSIGLDTVESVDVLRGGASALWGSDAIGGAVLVRTRAPRSGEARLRLQGGSHGERSLAADTGLALGGSWRARLGGQWFATDADYAFDDDARDVETRVENGDVRRAGGDLRLEGDVPAAGHLRLDAAVSASERGVPGSEEFPSPSARLEDRHRAVGARWTLVKSPRWRPSADVSWSRRWREYREPDAPFGPVLDRHENERRQAELSLDRFGERISMRLAAGVARDDLDSTTDGTPVRTTVDVRLRVTGDGHVAGLPLRGLGALRLDRTRGFEPFWSPRVGIRLELVPERFVARASSGLSYRAPSFDELFWPARATAAGNPDLRAERGRDVDLGVTWTPLAGVRGSLDGFARRVDDLIQWIPGASGVWRPHNVGSALLVGLEADASCPVPLPGPDLTLSAGGACLRSEDRSGEPNVDGRELVYRPRWTGQVAATLPVPGGGELESAWRFVDRVFVTRANTKTLPGHATGDVRYRHPVTPAITLDAAVTNVTDRTARDFRDYPLPGRSWKAGLTWRRSAS